MNKNKVPLHYEQRRVSTSFLENKDRLLILKRSHKVATHKGMWACVSGRIEKNKTPYQQALKEIHEETSLTNEHIKLIRKGTPISIIDKQYKKIWKVYPFRFKVFNPKKIKIDWEHTKCRWINPENIDKYNIVPKLKETWQRVVS